MESGYIVSPEKGKVMAGNINPSSDVAMIERIRRKNVNDSYAALMSLVPNLFPKATRSTILEEATAYISNLKDMVKLLEEKVEEKKTMKKKKRRKKDPPPLPTCQNIEVTVTGKTVFFGMKIPAIPRIHTEIFQVFEKHEVKIVNSTICRNGEYTNLTVTAVVIQEEAVARLNSELLTMLV